MFEIDRAGFEQGMRATAAAVKAASSRTVNAMGLNAKDKLLDALSRRVDRPTPFTMRRGAYRSTRPQIDGDAVSVEFRVAPIQTDYLWYILYGGDRRPGDPGTSKHKVWLPDFSTRDRFGGLKAGTVAKMIKRAKSQSAKLKAQSASQRARRVAGKTVSSRAWDKPHVAVASVMHGGKATWGVWQFPGRQRVAVNIPVAAASRCCAGTAHR